MAQPLRLPGRPLAPGYKEARGKSRTPSAYVEGTSCWRTAGRGSDLADLKRPRPSPPAPPPLGALATPAPPKNCRWRPAGGARPAPPAPAAPSRRHQVEPRLVGRLCVAWATTATRAAGVPGHGRPTVRVARRHADRAIEGQAVAAHPLHATPAPALHPAATRRPCSPALDQPHVPAAPPVCALGPAAAAFEAGWVARARGAAATTWRASWCWRTGSGRPRGRSAPPCVRYGAFDYPRCAHRGREDRPGRDDASGAGPLPQHLHEYLRGWRASGARSAPTSASSRRATRRRPWPVRIGPALQNLKRLSLAHAAINLKNTCAQAGHLKLGHLAFLARLLEADGAGPTETGTKRRLRPGLCRRSSASKITSSKFQPASTERVAG